MSRNNTHMYVITVTQATLTYTQSPREAELRRSPLPIITSQPQPQGPDRSPESAS